MSDTMNLNVRISGALKEYVAREVSEGDYESASEFVRDLIRQKKRASEEGFAELGAHLRTAAGAPDSEFEVLSASDIFERVEGNKAS